MMLCAVSMMNLDEGPMHCLDKAQWLCKIADVPELNHFKNVSIFQITISDIRDTRQEH
jgi:hypothetical protein